LQRSKTHTKESNQEIDQQLCLTRRIAMDCEMVGIGNGKESMIARVSIVNQYGACVYDKYVKPMEIVKNYRTPVSGIRPHHLKNGEDFNVVQKEVADIFKGRILIGHALYNDLGVLFLSHPKRLQRDTSIYFSKFTGGSTPSLKNLAAEFLGTNIQNGEHNSIEDARTTMQLYQLFKKQWESDLRMK
jgi:RNA exonuclease 4